MSTKYDVASKQPIHVPSHGPLDTMYAVVGQSPGRKEGMEGRPFVGPAGMLAKEWLAGTGLDPDSLYYCLGEGTRVLTGDFYWKPIEKLSIGDTVWACDEYPRRRGARRRLYESRVTALVRREAPRYQITTDKGTVVATAEHKWLSRRTWKRTDQLRPGHTIMWFSSPVERDRSWASGYVAGGFDADGSMSVASHLQFTQVPGKMDIISRILRERGFDFSFNHHGRTTNIGDNRCWALRINGGRSEIIRFMAMFHPLRLMERLREQVTGKSFGNDTPATVLSVEPVGVGPVYNLETDRRTFIAEGFVSHNCNVYEYVLLGDEKPSSTDVKHGIERVRSELSRLPNLKAAILFGSYAARCAFKLAGGITRAHGKQGKLVLEETSFCDKCYCAANKHEGDRSWYTCSVCGCIRPGSTTFPILPIRDMDCIACLHPSYVLRQRDLRRRQQLDNDCRSIVARLTFLDKPLVLPDIRFVPTRDVEAGTPMGLDTETAAQVGKRPDPRRDPLLITTLSDGSVIVGAPDIAPDAAPIAWNIPFDSVLTKHWDAKWHDGKMLAHLNGELDTSMKGQATKHLNRPMMDYDPELRERASMLLRQGDTGHEDVRLFAGYGVQDAVAHKDLFEFHWSQADAGTRNLYETVERPMLRLYSKWEQLGVFRLDRQAAQRKRDQIDLKIREMRRDLQAATGVDSPHAAARLAVALGIPSTSAQYVEREWSRLSQRQRDALTLIKELRSIEKQSTRIDTWLEWDLPLISTDWRPTAAWTGRAGSANDNLQNIPGPCGSCVQCRQEREVECPFNLKPLLLAPEGSVLYELDNSQAELRVAAHLSQDENMIRAFTEGIIMDGERHYDLHAWAQNILNIPSRRDAKIRVLATFYGQSEEGIRGDPRIQQQIRRTFAGYVRWSNKVKRLSIVPGLFGRKLHVPPHPNQAHREREAINSPSQGGAVDVLKIQCDRLEQVAFDTRHMIHDSALVRVDEADAGREIEETMRETMESAVKLSVPLKVGVGRWPLH